MNTNPHKEPTVTSLSPLRASASRQAFFFTVVVMLTGVATWGIADILWQDGLTGIEVALLVLFIPLFGMITIGFVQALVGFFILLRKDKTYSISQLLPDELPKADDMPATAIVIPIYNEDVSRVYEGIRMIYLDLARKGFIERFDFFILSDSNDPNKWIEEEVAWIDLCRQLQGFGRIFYRKRIVNLNRKSGNISDFLRRWGRKYRYMVVLDADSLMRAETLARMVQLMEQHPRAGIIQTVPAPIQAQTFFARLMQFAGTLYGPIFQAGLNYWQAQCGNFWGHNAIIRCAPFMEHCALPTLTGTTSQTRARFMSHDYVEAALMRRANYEVWMAYDLGGSYENLPPSPLDHACRDRRWCRGNLQHAWMLTAKGLHVINRLHLLLGILSYVSSPLWAIFLLFGMGQSRIAQTLLSSMGQAGTAAPLLDYHEVRVSLLLFCMAVTMLTLPKMLAVFLVLRDRRRRREFGGFLRIVVGFVLEHLISALLAPVQMLFNTRFVLEILMGRDVPWNPQRRHADGDIDWEGIMKSYAPHTIVGGIWAFLAWNVGPLCFWWLSPVTFGLMASIPVSVILSMPGLGQNLRKLGLFVIPVETHPPPIVSHLAKNLASIHQRLPAPPWLEEHFGITQVVIDPYVNAAHCSLLRRKKIPGGAMYGYLRDLADRLLIQGPTALNRREQMVLLRNANILTDLHERVWRLSEAQLSQWWRLSMHYYNILTDRPMTALYR